jgi:hypothetical protein
MPWKKNRDPLFRGDDASGVAVPAPGAPTTIVEHILFVGGVGRATPYHSTSENEDAADHFAGRTGRIYRTSARRAAENGVDHVGRIELIGLLQGKGKGRAKSQSAFLVMQARRLVEQWGEHLLDFSEVEPSAITSVVRTVYEP